jgi:predicted DNA-binding mobile mystery protein A
MPRYVTASDSFQARLSLDTRLDEMRAATQALTPPRGGWIRAIRTGLGMSATDLARRLRIHTSGVTRLEASEVNGAVSITSLRKAADALECDVVYALVPRRPLHNTVEDRAFSLARKSLRETGHTMALEDQGLDDAVYRALLSRLTEELMHSSGLWKEPRD